MKKSYPKIFLTLLIIVFTVLSTFPFTLSAQTAGDVPETTKTVSIKGFDAYINNRIAYYKELYAQNEAQTRLQYPDITKDTSCTGYGDNSETTKAYKERTLKLLENAVLYYPSQAAFDEANPSGSIDASVKGYPNQGMTGWVDLDAYITNSAETLAEGCPADNPATTLPTSIKVRIAGLQCEMDKDNKGIKGTYRGQSYILKYKGTSKTLTWFGGPNDKGVTAKETGSVSGKNLRASTGNYSAYPLASLLPAGAKVLLAKQSYKGENNAATNAVLKGKCLHVCKIDTVGGKKTKAELWLPVVDRGPRGDLKNKIDISPAAYKSFQDTLGLKSSSNLTGFAVALENCQ